MEKQWIENLRKRFADRQQPAPDGLWSSIETAMTEQRSTGKHIAGKTSRKHNTTALPLKICATAAAACALWLIGLYVTNKTAVRTDTNATQYIGNTAQVTQKKNASETASMRTKQQTPRTTPNMAGSHMTAGIAVQTIKEQDKQNTDKKEKAITETSAAVKDGGKQHSEIKRKELDSKKDVSPNKTDIDTGNKPSMAYSIKRNGRHDISFSIYGSNILYANNGTNNYNSGEMYANAMSQPLFSNAVFPTTAAENGKASVAKSNSYVKMKHHQPVKFGVAMRFCLTDRLALGTGLNYSYLSSDISTGSDYSGSETEQKLHYVGIPLNLIYDIWRSGSLNVYVTGGGAADICVRGKSRTWQKADNTVVDTSEEKMREHRPQLSVNAAAGVEYDINRHVGIYAEPGIGYYFNNHSGVTTVYKDKPLCFNLSIGLRFTVK